MSIFAFAVLGTGGLSSIATVLFIETFWTNVANKGRLSYKEVLRSLKNVREGLCVLYGVSSALERLLNCMFRLRCSLGMLSDGAIVWLLKCTAL